MKKFNNLTGSGLGLLIALAGILFSNSGRAQTLSASAGADQSVCTGDTAVLGGNPSASGGSAPYTYSWQPTSGLDDPAAANPNVTPASPGSYTLTVTDALGNSIKDVVLVSLVPLPTVVAGPDQTITGGTNTNLTASGAVNYSWSPPTDLTNANTATPTAEPASTTTFCVAGADANGCVNYDCMVLEVLPSDTIILYNAFTPNADGSNDVLYIGNLGKYPNNKLEVFNRNGKLVYRASPYRNDWDGKIDGAELPCATYYIVLNLGDGNGKRQGAVTIIR